MTDNVDHIVCTLEDENSLYGIGMIGDLKNESFTTKPIEKEKVD